MNSTFLIVFVGTVICGLGFLGFKEGTGRLLILLAFFVLALIFILTTKYLSVVPVF